MAKKRPLAEREAEFIEVTKDFLIQVNELDFCVRKRGKDVSQYHAYYGNLANALAHIRAEIIRDGLIDEARRLEDAINIITRQQEDFEAFVKTTMENVGYTNQKFFEARNGVKY